jgi:ethanolamine ammonia-lyase large subunit
VRQVLGLRPAPEFEAWLAQQGIFNAQGQLLPAASAAHLLGQLPPALR